MKKVLFLILFFSVLLPFIHFNTAYAEEYTCPNDKPVRKMIFNDTLIGKGCEKDIKKSYNKVVPTIFIHGLDGSQGTFKEFISSMENIRSDVAFTDIVIGGYNADGEPVSFIWEKYKNVETSSKSAANPIIMFVFPDADASFEDQTKWFKNMITKLKEEYEFDTINIVGHSMGGVIGTKYIEDTKDSNYPRVNKLVTLDSPILGASLAYLGGYSPADQDLMPGSSALEKIKKNGINFDPNTKILSYSGSQDLVVNKDSAFGLFDITNNNNILGKDIPVTHVEYSLIGIDMYGLNILNPIVADDVFSFLWLGQEANGRVVKKYENIWDLYDDVKSFLDNNPYLSEQEEQSEEVKEDIEIAKNIELSKEKEDSTGMMDIPEHAIVLKNAESVEFTNNTPDTIEIDNGYWKYGYYDKLDVAIYNTNGSLSRSILGAEKSTNITVEPGQRAVITNRGDKTIVLDGIRKVLDENWNFQITDEGFAPKRVSTEALSVVKLTPNETFEFKNDSTKMIELGFNGNYRIDHYYNNSENPNTSSGKNNTQMLWSNDRIVVTNTGTTDLYIYGGKELFNPTPIE